MALRSTDTHGSPHAGPPRPDETLGSLPTEAGGEPGADYDLRATDDLVSSMLRTDEAVLPAVAAATAAIAATIDAVSARLDQGGRLIYVGAGSSGRLAALDAAECESTFAANPGHVVALVAGGIASPPLEQEAAEDDSAAGASEVGESGVGASAGTASGVAASGVGASAGAASAVGDSGVAGSVVAASGTGSGAVASSEGGASGAAGPSVVGASGVVASDVTPSSGGVGSSRAASASCREAFASPAPFGVSAGGVSAASVRSLGAGVSDKAYSTLVPRAPLTERGTVECVIA